MLLIGNQFPCLKSVEWADWRSVNILDYQGLLFDCQGASFTPDDNVLQAFLRTFSQQGHPIFVILPRVSKQLELTFLPDFRVTVIPQRGDTVIVRNRVPPFDTYTEALNGHEVYFVLRGYRTGQDINVQDVVNNVNMPLCANHGNIFLFHPPAQGKAPKALEIIVSFFGPEFEECQPDPPPPWADDLILRIPGSKGIRNGLSEIDEKIRGLEGQRHREEEELQTLSMWGQLLWLTGIPLQRLVLKAFRFLDFEIEARPETGHTEDFVAKLAGAVFLIEATGSVGSITIEKGRQLMHWVTDSEVENCHGLLVGNAFSKEPPENRPPTLNHHVFTPELKKYAEKHGFSLLDTTELFRIVCAKLAGQPVAMDLVCARLHQAGVVTFADGTKTDV